MLMVRWMRQNAKRYTKMLEEIPEVIEEAIALESKCQFAKIQAY